MKDTTSACCRAWGRGRDAPAPGSGGSPEERRGSDEGKDMERILVLGVGNILYTDEGIGVRAMELARERWDFPENVTLLDGGTLGMA